MSNQLLLRRRAMMQSKKDNILTFKAEAANSSVKLIAAGSPPAVTLEYNLNGSGWLPYTVGDTISLPNVGDKVKMRGNNNALGGAGKWDCHEFQMTGLIRASGDITSLLNLEGGDVEAKANCFKHLFRSCSSLITAPNLPSTLLGNYCYQDMFFGCTNLTMAPELPALLVQSSSYQLMFTGCKSLNIAPNLPATSVKAYGYANMFQGCTNLVITPEIYAMSLESSACAEMFSGCSNLIIARLTPTTLNNWCFQDTFKDCINLKSVRVANLNNSERTFNNCSSCEKLVIKATTPPTIYSNTITGLKSDCKIYVPYSEDHSILNAYKAKQYWSDRANYIFELDENGEIPS